MTDTLLRPHPAIVAGAAPPRSALDEVVEALLRGNDTSVALLPTGLEAFMLRAFSARAAGRSLDLQYYRWSDDVTGGLLAREVLQAADRGVRVRILLDDSYALGTDRRITLLAAHPMIEVRLFNTARLRWLGQAGMGLEFALGGWHLNHRMHNKNWVADGKLALVGGRNIADAYFDAAGDFNFRDLDLLIAGEASIQAQRVFETYWSSSLARPVTCFCKPAELGPQALATFREALDRIPATQEASYYLQALATTRAQVLAQDYRLLPAGDTVRVLADPPAKAKGRNVPGGLAPVISNVLREARQEAVLISPYFVPGKAGMALLEEMVRRGVRIRVVTNSLAATDVVAVHSGYARYRHRLLELGIDLYELKRSGRSGKGVFGSRGASLHTKAFMIDREQIFVGTFNLDPRSANLNTEMGAFARHPGLAALLDREYRRLTDLRRSYRVSLTPQGRLRWTDDLGSTRHEPEASWGRRAMAELVRWLPLEAQL